MSSSPSFRILTIVTLLAFSANAAPAQSAADASAAPSLRAGLASPFSSTSATFASYTGRAKAPAQFYSPSDSPHSMAPLSGLGVDAKVGLSGIGFDLAVPILPTVLNLRGGASFFSYTLNNFQANSLNINGQLKLQNSDIMVDVFPFRGRFRVSGGLSVYNDTNVNGNFTVAAGNSVTIGSTRYYSDPSNPLVGNALFKFGNNVGPRFTIGTGNLVPKTGRWTFQSELGFQYIGQPMVNYTFNGRGCTNYNGITYSGCGPIASSDVSQEQTNLQNDMSAARFFPVVSVGVGFRIF